MKSAIGEYENELKKLCQMCRNVLVTAERLLEQAESASAPQPDKKKAFEDAVARAKADILTKIPTKKA